MRKFGPNDDREASTFAYVRLVTEVQYEIEKLMKQSDVSQKELAERLGVTPARVAQLLNDRGNLTLRTLGRIAHALKHEVSVSWSRADSIVNVRPVISALVRADEKRNSDHRRQLQAGSLQRVMNVLRVAPQSATSCANDALPIGVSVAA